MPAPALAASWAMAVAFSAAVSLAPPSMTMPARASRATNITASSSVSDPRSRGWLIRCSLLRWWLLLSGATACPRGVTMPVTPPVTPAPGTAAPGGRPPAGLIGHLLMPAE